MQFQAQQEYSVNSMVYNVNKFSIFCVYTLSKDEESDSDGKSLHTDSETTQTSNDSHYCMT